MDASDRPTETFAGIGVGMGDDGVATLTVTMPDAPAIRRVLSGTLVVGRSREADICVDDASISRKHVAFHAGPTPFVEDLGGKNGTYLAGRRLPANQRVALRPGVVVEIGRAIATLGNERSLEEPEPAIVSLRFDEFSEPMERAERLLAMVAPSPISVILAGETGVGKDVHAEKVHRLSAQRDGPFIAVNCAAIADNLVESELFGHERGAFTGAINARVGLLEAANNGTVFLDEVGELSLAAQSKLLRALEKREVTPVGSTRSRPFDARFVAATHRDLEVEVAAGRFRMDLYFRLNGITIVIPPLRERKEELVELAALFVEHAARQFARPVVAISDEALAALHAHDWPGNVRELKNVIERAVLLCGRGPLRAEHLQLRASMHAPPRAYVVPAVPAPVNYSVPQYLAPPFTPPATQPPAPPAGERDVDLSKEVERYERQRIEEALIKAAGNQTTAAQALGITRRALVYRIRLWGIDLNAFRRAK